MGQDHVWSTYTTSRYINYTNLPAGNIHYVSGYPMAVFVGAADVYCCRSSFLETIWFRLLLTVVIIGVLFLAVRYYMQYLRRRYSDEKIRFFTRMAHDIRTSLMLIKAPIEELHKERNSHRGELSV